MTVGKYSPTVVEAYAQNQDWFTQSISLIEDADGKYAVQKEYDAMGFDRYGYNKNFVDRAGVNELNYMLGTWVDEDYQYILYQKILCQWGADINGQPKELENT